MFKNVKDESSGVRKCGDKITLVFHLHNFDRLSEKICISLSHDISLKEKDYEILAINSFWREKIRINQKTHRPHHITLK